MILTFKPTAGKANGLELRCSTLTLISFQLNTVSFAWVINQVYLAFRTYVQITGQRT